MLVLKVGIIGELELPEGMTHQELVEVIFEELKEKRSIHFSGKTKIIEEKQEYIK